MRFFSCLHHFGLFAKTSRQASKSLILLLAVLGLWGALSVGAAAKPPNILFVIMDDVGIDQLKTFAPSAPNAVITPNIDTIAQHGVKFSNCWMMPECSPSRSCFFTGRYPFRTGVAAAILSYNIPQAHVSPYELTVPRILANAGYSSALVGKYHLGGPDNNPAGIGTPASLGWDYFNGNLAGGPPTIDATLGGQTTDKSKYPCGFPTGTQRGVGWFINASNQIYIDDNNGAGYTGHECVTAGGIPALTASGDFAATSAEATITPNFTTYSGYYAWKQTINNGTATPTTATSRKYMSTVNTDAAIQWVAGQSNSNQPWMCTVSYNTIHTPYQQPPTNLYPPGFTWPPGVPEGNQTTAQVKVVSDLMLYGMDQEIGRLLVGLGLATRLPSGELDYHPESTDTMVVLLGDNGTLFSSVNVPYDPLRAKGTTYQTGVSAPLLVAGPQVQSAGRTVSHMVNAVDLYSLFGEIAGLDVRSIVPSSHLLDCQPMMPYLTNPAQTSIRQYNFSQIGAGAKPPSVQLWPSVFTIFGQKIGNDHLFDKEELAVEDGAEWFGPPTTTAYQTCCDLKAAVYPSLVIVPTQSSTIRDERYKLVVSSRTACETASPNEFYDLQPTALNPLGLDTGANNLLTSGAPLTAEQNQHYTDLQAQLNTLLNSEPACLGDGNMDKVVDLKDSKGVVQYWGQPSVFDINMDGVTDQTDLNIVLANFGHISLPPSTAFVVTTTADSGAGSLREAVANAASASGPNTITFASGLSNGTITLLSQIAINDATGPVIIDASGLPKSVTINGGGATRLFSVAAGSNVQLDSLTLTGGNGSGGDGGAIYNSGSCTLKHCTLTGNSAVGNGGALFNIDRSSTDQNPLTLTVIECTLTGNTATNGGAVSGPCYLSHSTIAGNSAQSGGGMWLNSNETFILSNTILAVNSASAGGNDAYNQGTCIRVGTSICPGFVNVSPTGTFSGNGSILSTDPHLAALDDYGGSTKTMALRPGSPALGAANGNALAIDQRGFPRTGGYPDIGAYEAGTFTGFNIWAMETTGSIPSVTFDSDHDGFNAGLEYGLNGNPALADMSIAPALTGQVGRNTFTFRVQPAATDLVYTVQRSPDLITWTNIYRYTSSNGQVTTALPYGQTPAYSTQFVTDTSTGVRLFWRLLVELSQ